MNWQYSPDGRWWWDGQRWQPVGVTPSSGPSLQPPGGARPRRRRNWWLIGCGGGAAIAVLAVAAFVILGTLAYRSGQIGPPHDFPVYPGSQLTSFNTFFHPSGRQDRIIWEAPDPQAQVQAFYDIHLNEGDWEATATDPRTGTIGFQRRSSVRTHGLLTMLTHGQQTRIEVEIDS